MSVEAEIKMGDLLKNLEKVPEKVQKRILRGAVRASAKPIVQEARRLVPTSSGNLRKSIGVTMGRIRNGVLTAKISPRTGGKHDGFYGRFVEIGTAKMSPKPFLRPAFERKGEESIKYFKEYMKKRLEKELAK